ncbi:MAG: penicillin acylase family protein [bacterium]|nr:penicillin acylase family protein [bacterium]
MKRWLMRGLALVAVLAGIVAVVEWWSFRAGTQKEGPEARGSRVIPELAQAVEILRDPLGVPHVKSTRSDDASLALGFVHAQDRLWQMEMLRRAARGTLSEVFGASTVDEDRLVRTLGLGRDAEAEVTQLSGSAARTLDAYSAGVNSWIEHLRSGEAPLPYEFEFLEYEPEPWSPADTLAILRLRAWNTGRSLGASLLLDQLVREVGGVPARDFFPTRPEDGAHDPLGPVLELGKAADRLASIVGMNGPVGSLGFVVSSERSATGGAILANDPHVQFGVPALFYLAHLRVNDDNVSGATWPGVPLFFAGNNGEIAWGQVALHASVSDLFDETFHPTDPLRFDRNGRWRKAVRRVETIQIKDAEPLEVEVLSTHHGPVLRSMEPEETRVHTLALRWTGHHKRSGFEALLRVQRAGDWDEFRKSLRRLPAPAATFLYADREGHIGTQVAGHLPVRAIETGLLPVTGGSSFYDWRGFMDFDGLPSSYGDKPWIVVSTHPDAADFKAPIVWLWSSPAGARRIGGLLSSSRHIDLERVLEVQRDRGSHRGRSTVRYLVDDVEPTAEHARRIRTLLLDWDGRAVEDSIGASVYHVFRQRLTVRLLQDRFEKADERLEQITANTGPLPGIVLARYLDRARDRQLKGVVEQALDDTWRHMRTHVSSNPKKWNWGRLHQVRLKHDFEKLGIGRVQLAGQPLGLGPFPAAGGPDSAWTMYHRSLPENEAEVGPALRYAVDMSDADHAQIGLAGGQSGHAGHPNYSDALQDWLAGRARPLWMHWSDVSYHQVGKWELRPTGD